MPAPISLIVPTLNAASTLPHLLDTAGEGLAAGLLRELVISDGGSSDATQAIAEAAGAVWLSGPPGRGGQIGRACAAARGDWLLVLHADTRLPAGWPQIVQPALCDADLAWTFRLTFRAEGVAPLWVAAWANLRSRVFSLPYGDQGMLISQSLLTRIGGYRDIPLMEDVALARTLAGRIRLLPATVTTGAERYQADGWMRRGARNLWTLARFAAGVAPEKLVSGYASSRAANCRR